MFICAVTQLTTVNILPACISANFSKDLLTVELINVIPGLHRNYHYYSYLFITLFLSIFIDTGGGNHVGKVWQKVNLSKTFLPFN